jgi:hypothetical protein
MLIWAQQSAAADMQHDHAKFEDPSEAKVIISCTADFRVPFEAQTGQWKRATEQEAVFTPF